MLQRQKLANFCVIPLMINRKTGETHPFFCSVARWWSEHSHQRSAEASEVIERLHHVIFHFRMGCCSQMGSTPEYLVKYTVIACEDVLFTVIFHSPSIFHYPLLISLSHGTHAWSSMSH